MRRPGLRTRVTAVFAGGALLLAAALALGTYEITRHSVLTERVRTAERAAYFDAAVVRQGLASDEVDVVAVLRALDTGQGRRPLIRRNGQWFARNADDGITSAIPARLLALVEQGRPAVQRILVAGEPALVVGLPLRGLASDFYEVQSLTEVQGTLRTLAGTLAAVALGTTLGAAALSLWLAGRVLRPLTSVTRAAERIGSGDLSARMDATNDPDLTALTGSFNSMAEEVAAQVERERRFAADVSHELRSPLQTLTSASQVLLNRRDQLDARSRAAADLVAAESTRFTVLVQGLLELAKHDAPARLGPADVGELVRRAAARHRLDEDRVRVEPEVTSWVLDEQRVERVLDNLLDNAVKHGGGVLALSAATGGGRLQLVVDDAGPGVPPDERELVFGRFGRGRAAHARDGSEGVGLGLSLVARHVAAHGGTVTVLDRPGGGARFCVELPAGPT